VKFAPLAWLPPGAVGLLKEVGRHLLRRPVVGLAVYARTRAGEIVLVRRGDTGTWALPGGTVEWGETLHATLLRELSEEAGIDEVRFERVVGVFGGPGRDPRFHAVTVVVAARVGAPVRRPSNPLEITEVGLFVEDSLPRPLAMGMDDFVEAARGTDVVLE
jgi:8-oxo-dGTP diphosphatase